MAVAHASEAARSPRSGLEYRRWFAVHGDEPAVVYRPEKASKAEIRQHRKASAQPQNAPPANARRERYVNHIIYPTFLGICLTQEELRNRQPKTTEDGMIGAHQYYAEWLTLWAEVGTAVANAIEHEDRETIRELTGANGHQAFTRFAEAIESEMWRKFMEEETNETGR
jgi:hypothetical protein